ncbi:hypothetical protein AALO_G00215720 [Alosa alosa]|uniref:Uncharacterized protein n=1 Tax=Alosa alosa TaxID=278164 RepID=A0AAV6G5G1_9TELE|nr:hypothetical protein AALO_G00215720 [Alosa alosa]
MILFHVMQSVEKIYLSLSMCTTPISVPIKSQRLVIPSPKQQASEAPTTIILERPAVQRQLYGLHSSKAPCQAQAMKGAANCFRRSIRPSASVERFAAGLAVPDDALWRCYIEIRKHAPQGAWWPAQKSLSSKRCQSELTGRDSAPAVVLMWQMYSQICSRVDISSHLVLGNAGE